MFSRWAQDVTSPFKHKGSLQKVFPHTRFLHLIICNLVVRSLFIWFIQFHRHISLNGQLTGVQGQISSSGTLTAILLPTGACSRHVYSEQVSHRSPDAQVQMLVFQQTAGCSVMSLCYWERLTVAPLFFFIFFYTHAVCQMFFSWHIYCHISSYRQDHCKIS